MAEPQAPDRTEALCPVCLRRLPALRVRRGDEACHEVWLTRVCPEHGEASAVIWRGAPRFDSWRRPKTPSAPPVVQTQAGLGCPFDCGLCPEHGQHTCTAVVEVTDRCDLCCPVCYAGSGPGCAADPLLSGLAQRLAELRRVAGACNLQLSGGEPTCRADLPEIITVAAGLGFGLVQLNTNGLRLGAEPGYAQQLAQAGLQSVFLQFDGPDEACRVLRGRPLLAHKLRALDACARAGLGVVLVPTLLRGVNERFLGEIVRLAVARLPVVRGVHFQPAAGFGRFPGAMREADRLTLPEVLTLLVEQTGGQLRARDFHPPGCEHERCSFSGRFSVQDGRLSPLAGGGCCAPGPLSPGISFGQSPSETTGQPLDESPGESSGQAPGQSATQPPGWMPGLASDVATPPTAAEGARRARASVAGQWGPAPAPARRPPQDDFERFLAGRGADTLLSISCMAFQDALTLDLERVRGCCIHTQAPDGRLVPFCLYNLTAADGAALYRGRNGCG